MSELDEINKELLRLLCENSRYQYSELREGLAKRGHELTREAVEYRVKKMIEEGVIRKFAMITNPEKLGYHICCHITMELADPKKRDEIGEMLAELPNTAYVHASTSTFDIACRIFFTDAENMIAFLDTLEADGRVKDFDLDIIRKTYKVGPISPP
ncbi:MAG: Lrp/AsnC family transcriptional regulator [Candidatus Hydrothermarchaeales archaeon]